MLHPFTTETRMNPIAIGIAFGLARISSFRPTVAVRSALIGMLAGFAAVAAAPALGQTQSKVADEAEAAAAQTRMAYQESKGAICDSNLCSVFFNAVPLKKRLEITSVSCYYATFPGSSRVGAASFISLSSTGTELAAVHVVPVLASADSGSANSAANHQTLLFIKAGGRARAFAGTGDATQIRMDCTIVGWLVSLR